MLQSSAYTKDETEIKRNHRVLRTVLSDGLAWSS